MMYNNQIAIDGGMVIIAVVMMNGFMLNTHKELNKKKPYPEG